MKILLIGDTHGKLDKFRDIFPKITSVDLIAHTGDHISDAAGIEKEFSVPVVSVRGNCDGGYSHDDFEIISTEAGDILLTHGHMENVKGGLMNLFYKAKENGCTAAFFGHTHVPLTDEYRGVHFVNPGSLTLPRDGSDGSYAIVRTAENSFNASVAYYSTVMGTGGARHFSSGYIRNLLNNSDRL